jgi:tetratricopeptide (TPR) repeat protein
VRSVAMMIDKGLEEKDVEFIKKAIEIGKKLIDTEEYTEKNLCRMSYLIANGYSDIYTLEFDRAKGYSQILDNKNLQNAKFYFREALRYSDNVNTELKSTIWTNYGNCMDHLCRNMESLFAYNEALKINPNFSMAIGNKAEAMKYFADLSGVYRVEIYKKAYKLLKSVINRKDLIRVGGKAAKTAFEHDIKIIESTINKDVLKKDLIHKKYDKSKMSTFEKFYVNLSLENDLFLNLHIHETECEESIVDPIFISKNLDMFNDLAKILNQIKEDYAVARLLFVQSQFTREDFDNINNRTMLVDTNDHSMFGLHIGLLKSAFKESFNILDKISRFINDYYGLGYTDNDRIYFPTIWKVKINNNRDFTNDYYELESSNKGIIKFTTICRVKIGKDRWDVNPKIKESNNPGLLALYDINSDLSTYNSNLNLIRNKLVHEKLIIHNSNWDGIEDDYNIKYENMFLSTIKLFKIVKSAIIYLINFVEIEERKKKIKITKSIELK